ATPAAAIQLKRLTYDSKAFGPAISPSGEYVAYKFYDGSQDSVRLKNVANGSTIQIMPPSTGGYNNLAFSPDGNYLYFTTLRPGIKNSVIARVPVFGGTPQYLVEEVWSSFDKILRGVSCRRGLEQLCPLARRPPDRLLSRLRIGAGRAAHDLEP